MNRVPSSRPSQGLSTFAAATLILLAQPLYAQEPEASTSAGADRTPDRVEADSRASGASATARPAESGTAPSTPLDDLEQVVVTGEQPGPGLWKVTHGTHVLWIVSSVSPTPKDMKWRSGEVESIVASAKMVLGGTNVRPNIGLFRGLRYLPSLLRTRWNPDKAVLKDLITPEEYERWLVLRSQYELKDDDIERMRPMFIALMLYSKAIQKAGRAEWSVTARVVYGAARKHKIPTKESELIIDVDNPKQMIKDFTETPRDNELACFRGVLDHLEPEIAIMKARANAWAVGDVETFRSLPKPENQATCIKAMTSAPGLQADFASLEERLNVQWLSSVESMLAANDVSVALMPLDDILREDGPLEMLRSRGYTVESPPDLQSQQGSQSQPNSP